MGPAAIQILPEGEKAEEYRQAGIPEYWVVEAERRELVVHRLAGGAWMVETVGGGSVVSRAVPGFWLDGRWLFQEPLPPADACLREILGFSPGIAAPEDAV